MVDTLVESASNVELILKYFDMFLKLKDLTDSPGFQEVDLNHDGWVFPKDFREKMEQTKSYTPYVTATLFIFITCLELCKFQRGNGLLNQLLRHQP